MHLCEDVFYPHYQEAVAKLYSVHVSVGAFAHCYATLPPTEKNFRGGLGAFLPSMETLKPMLIKLGSSCRGLF